MAIIKLETNANIPEERRVSLGASLRDSVARLTGEQDFEVHLFGDRRMRMAAADERLVHVEIKGVEYPKERAQPLARAVTAIVDEHLAVGGDQVYIAVVSNRLSMWRVNGSVGKNA